MTKSKIDTASDGSDSDSDIVMNSAMTPSKLKFIKNSSLKTLISEDDLEAAQNELEQQKTPKRNKKNDTKSSTPRKRPVPETPEDSKQQQKKKKLNPKSASSRKLLRSKTGTAPSPNEKPDSTAEEKTEEATVDNDSVQVKKASSQSEEKASVAKSPASNDQSKKNRRSFDVPGTDLELNKHQLKVLRDLKKRRGKRSAQGVDLATNGVVYVGHVPHGFYEEEMDSYFAQYGTVLDVRVSRSQKTGRSRGYAFVRFEDKDVARIAAASMDGYLMHGSRMVAHVVPDEKVHADMFKPAIIPRKLNASVIARKEAVQKSRNPLTIAKHSKSIQKNATRKKAQLAKMQIEYAFPQVIKNPTVVKGKGKAVKPLGITGKGKTVAKDE